MADAAHHVVYAVLCPCICPCPGPASDLETDLRFDYKKKSCAERPCRGMQLGDFEYTAAPLALGASGGNRFEITLRDVDGATTDQV
jgi:hypothetical protein